jgi:lipoate-protein ligase B
VTRLARLLDLGRAPYGAVWDRQKELVEARQADRTPDTLILVEHDEVVTLGRRRDAGKNVLSRDLPVVEIERGGDVTYHGPGQLVAYPILKLEGDERDLHAYLRRLEAALLDTLAAFGLHGRRNPGLTGAWIGPRKVASIGIAVRRWVTFHGLALNVSTDLTRFSAINPCGLDAAVMTSMSEAAGRAISLDAVKPALVSSLGAALGRTFSG